MNAKNYMVLIIPSKSQNEAFARVATAAFAAQLDPTIEELADIKTAVSEAVTNSIIHGYEDSEGEITIKCRMDEYGVEIEIRTRVRVYRMWNRPGSPFIPPNRSWNGRVWALP